MGLFKEVFLLPIAPVRGTVKVAEYLAEEADRRLYDEENIKRELIQLEIDAEEGLVGDAEREAKEEELFERLSVSRWREAEALEEAKALETEEQVPHG